MQRIMIIGAPGSGKTTLAREIGARTGLPVVHYEPMYFLPGWAVRPREDVKAMALAASTGQAWVFDGAVQSFWDEQAGKADLILFLDMPRWLQIWQILLRVTRDYGQTTPDMAAGCTRRYQWGLLRFVWRYPLTRRRRVLRFLQRWDGRRKVLVLHSRREIAAFLEAMSGNLADKPEA